MPFSEILMNGADLCLLCTFVYSLFVYKHANDNIRLICWFIFISFATQFISLLLWVYSLNNLVLLHISVPLTFTTLVLFYRGVLGAYINPKIFNRCIMVFLVFCVVNSVFIQDIHSFNSNGLSAEAVVMLILSLITYGLPLYQKEEKPPYYMVTLNLVNTGVFLYFTSNLLLFFFGTTIMHHFSIQLSQNSWILHSAFSIMLYSLIFAGLWKYPSKKKVATALN